MLNLPNVTLACVDTCYYNITLDAFHWNLSQCKFGAVKLFTDDEFYVHGREGLYAGGWEEKIERMGIEIINVNKIAGKTGYWSYSWFLMKELYKYITTDYILITQQDGWIINPDKWEDEFLNYDYIGSKWHCFADEHNVGNGGFSLRSQKLHKCLGEDNVIDGGALPEDNAICREYRRHLESTHGIRYAHESVADRFSHDTPPFLDSFGFHCIDRKGHEFRAAAKFGYFG